MTKLQLFELAKAKGYTYDHITGEIRGIGGNVITRKDKRGYICSLLRENWKQYEIKAHRFAWFMYYGELPKNHIDHIDGNPSNNKIENLRDVTHQQNHMNRKKVKGYCWHISNKKFQASIILNGKNIYLGYFKTKEEARNTYLEAKKKYHKI